MARSSDGTGGFVSSAELFHLRHPLGISQAPLDLNRASLNDLSRVFGRTTATALAAARQVRPIESASDLIATQLVDSGRLAALSATTYGTIPARPLLTSIDLVGERAYVGEPFTLSFNFTAQSPVKAEILSLTVRFPSGWTGEMHRRLDYDAVASGAVQIGPFISQEAGEIFVMATLRDESGDTHRLGASSGVFTRNPVQIYVRPTHWTQSGTVGAPKFDFGARNWTCFADVRWVNGTGETVNLGRRVKVRVTDSGSEIATFEFDLSGDVVVAPWSTAYGNWYTWHNEGSSIFNVFHGKGDLTYEYSMSGSGHDPHARQIWRTMRVIGFNIIRVGDFTDAERNEYRRAAADIASGIHQSRDMTVYGVGLYRIEGTPQMEADKTRFRFIDSQGEIDALRSAYTVRNWYLDAFFVEGRWDGAFGSSPAGGPVDKEGNSSGLVIRRDSDTVNLGQTFAHEAGHYLGLDHADDDDGIADTDPADPRISDNFIFSSSRRDSTVVTRGQSSRMRLHGLVRSMTP